MMDSEPVARRPIYVGTRTFLGRRDLVVSFYTRKCQFQCSYCALPLRSASGDVSEADLSAQIDEVFDEYAPRLNGFQQFSFGNEGSALDRRRFHPASLHRLLERAADMTALEVLSVETRPEYARREALEDVRARTRAPVIDVTIGFETQDDHLRQVVLRKNITRLLLEDRVRVLGDLGMRLTSYVMVKPAPGMTDEQGAREAIATMEYLAELCGRHGVGLVVYLTPMYVAQGSYLERTTSPGDWVPPAIQSIFDVAVAGWRMGLPVYCGLWSEELADEAHDFRGRDGYDPALRKALVRFNGTGDASHLTPFLVAGAGL